MLALAGVSIGLIAANTPHIVFDEVRQQSPIELVSIVEAARDAARERGLRRLALFGTKFTMQGRFYHDVFFPSGIELVTARAKFHAGNHEHRRQQLTQRPNVIGPLQVPLTNALADAHAPCNRRR